MKMSDLIREINFANIEEYAKSSRCVRYRSEISGKKFVRSVRAVVVAQDERGFEREWEVRCKTDGTKEYRPLLLTEEGYRQMCTAVLSNYPRRLKDAIKRHFPGLDMGETCFLCRIIYHKDVTTKYTGQKGYAKESRSAYKKIKPALAEAGLRRISYERFKDKLKEYFEKYETDWQWDGDRENESDSVEQIS